MPEEKMNGTQTVEEVMDIISKIDTDMAAQMVVLKTICHGLKAQGFDIPAALQDAYDNFPKDQQIRLAEVHKTALAISN